MQKIYLDLRNFDNDLKIHKYLKEKLNFPDYYGNNLDALYDILVDYDEDITIIIKNSEPENKFLRVFKDIISINLHIKLEMSDDE